MSFGRYRGSDEGDFGPPPPPFRIRRRGVQFRSFGNQQRWIILAVALILLFIVLDTGKGLYVNWLWFDGAGYRSVYSKMLVTRAILFAGGALLFILFFGGNALLAARPALRTPARGLREEELASLRRLWLVGLIAGTIFLAIVFGTIAASHWDTVLAFLKSESFGIQDPQFHRDVSFFIFDLPALRFFYGWLLGMSILTVLTCAALYGLASVGSADARWAGRSRIHLSLLLLIVIALFVWRYWLARFELDFSQHGV